MNLKESAQKLADKGRNGDTILAHITPEEAEFLKMIGGSGTINPDTGLPEFFFKSFFRPITNIIEEVASGVGGLIEDTAGNVESVVKQVGESPLLPLVANYFVPGSGAFIAASQTLDQGGSLEDAIANGTKQFVIDQAVAQITGSTATDTTGLDMGDVIPTTPAQLEGLYPAGGTFLPPTIDTTGLDMGDVIPTTPMDITSVIPEATPVAPSTTLPIEAQDPFGYKPPISLDAKTALNLANLGLTANAILNPPDLNMGGTGAGWYDLQPIPEGWSPPVYQTEFTPIDLASIFQGADLTGTQWANQMQPVQFAPAPTMQDLTNILQGIDFGQTTTGNQSVKG